MQHYSIVSVSQFHWIITNIKVVRKRRTWTFEKAKNKNKEEDEEEENINKKVFSKWLKHEKSKKKSNCIGEKGPLGAFYFAF